MRARSFALLGSMLAVTLAQPVLVGQALAVPAEAGVQVQAGTTVCDSRVPLPEPPSARDRVGSGEAMGTMVWKCDCLTVRLPTFDSPFERALAAG